MTSLRPAPPVTTGPGTRGPAVLADLGLALVAAGTVLILALHVLPPTNRISPWRRTISEYALGSSGWAFDAGVLAIAIGSLVVLLALVRAGVVPGIGGTSLFVLGWSAALVVLVIFEKYDYAAGASRGPDGLIHRMASLVAFLCLPPAALLAARIARRRAELRTAATRVRTWALVSCLALALLAYAIGYGAVAEVAWWRVFPLGGLERLIAGAEVVTVLALAALARRATRPPTSTATSGALVA